MENNFFIRIVKKFTFLLKFNFEGTIMGQISEFIKTGGEK